MVRDEIASGRGTPVVSLGPGYREMKIAMSVEEKFWFSKLACQYPCKTTKIYEQTFRD